MLTLARRSEQRAPSGRVLGRRRPGRRVLAALTALASATGLAVVAGPGSVGASSHVAPKDGVTPFPAPAWVDTVGSVALSSPTTGTIGGQSVIAFGTESGYLYVMNAQTGAELPGWPQPVEPQDGVPTAVESSPTIAYLDGPSAPPTIIVGAGSTYVAHQQGGLVAFNANGTVRFRFQTQDVFGEWNNATTPDGYREAVFSTPAIGDVTGNGEQDIVFGSWDHRLYALTPQGRLVKGFPLDTQDTIWSSPALYHLRGSSRTEDIIVGGDASGRAGCYGGFLTDYTYRQGAPQIVWQHCENQTIWSSPAIGVINTTGRPAVVVGTGFGETPPYKSASFQMFAFYGDNGSAVPGWPVATAGPAFGSPAIGTLAGSNTPDIVDTSWCTTCTANGGSSMVYAWNGYGQQVWSQTLAQPNDFASPVLADLTGSGGNDVVVGSSGGLYALDGSNGAFMFGGSQSSPINSCSVLNSVAVENVPGSGAGSGWHLFEACGGPKEVTATGYLYDYPLPATPGSVPPWPAWRGGAGQFGFASSTLPLLRRAAVLRAERAIGARAKAKSRAAAIRSSARPTSR
ncbi:MAG: repeat-containing protein [Acidimicrobiaceae bacterium]|nr:repeat-containing protein [Acidimicrobiaceae bacterium]